jgi:hypothetical protein
MAGRKRIELDITEIERLAGLGLTEQEICDSLGISDETLRRRKLELMDFVEAIKRGKARAHAHVSNWLYELCSEKNLGAIVWYEKTRHGLSDKLEVRSEAARPELAPSRGNTLAAFTARPDRDRSLNGAAQVPSHGTPLGQDGSGVSDGDHDSL